MMEDASASTAGDTRMPLSSEARGATAVEGSRNEPEARSEVLWLGEKAQED
jgi:hypothetical protein